MKKFLALILAIMTLFSLVAVSALAEDGETGGETPAGSEQTEPAVNTPQYKNEITVEADSLDEVQPVMVVDIKWGPAMTPKFCHERKTYDATTHKYTTQNAHWEGNTKTWVEVYNHSNVKVKAKCTLTLADEAFRTVTMLLGRSEVNLATVDWSSPSDYGYIENAVNTTTAPMLTFYIQLDPSVTNNMFAGAVAENTKMCDVEITIEQNGKPVVR